MRSLPPADAGPTKIDFDAAGPAVQGQRLLTRTTLGLEPNPPDELRKLFHSGATLGSLTSALQRIAWHMNRGDLASAAIATCTLRLPPLADGVDRQSAFEKARVDDPKHPGYPKDEPGSKGGQFRPKTGAAISDADRRADTEARLKRRAVRDAIRRVLSARRILMLLGENLGSVLTFEIPGLDVVVSSAALADDLATLKSLSDEIKGTQAAIDFLDHAPYDLKDLMVSPSSQGFTSFDAFKKVEIDKIFGPAGDFMDYHHLIEQGSNASSIPQSIIQSTDNIIRIPRLLHEEISSFYSSKQIIGGQATTPRTWLAGQSTQTQRDFAIGILRQWGILK